MNNKNILVLYNFFHLIFFLTVITVIFKVYLGSFSLGSWTLHLSPAIWKKKKRILNTCCNGLYFGKHSKSYTIVSLMQLHIPGFFCIYIFMYLASLPFPYKMIRHLPCPIFSCLNEHIWETDDKRYCHAKGMLTNSTYGKSWNFVSLAFFLKLHFHIKCLSAFHSLIFKRKIVNNCICLIDSLKII